MNEIAIWKIQNKLGYTMKSDTFYSSELHATMQIIATHALISGFTPHLWMARDGQSFWNEQNECDEWMSAFFTTDAMSPILPSFTLVKQTLRKK